MQDPLDSLLQIPLLDLRTLAHKDKNPAHANEHIIQMLDQLIKHTKANRTSTSDTHRIRSFERAKAAIAEFTEPITSGRQALALDGVGKGIAERIDTLLQGGSVVELSETDKILNELQTVNGIGIETAKRLVEKGVKSVRELQALHASGRMPVCKGGLTHAISVGLKYYDDFLARIPREEIAQFEQFLADFMGNEETYVCGSYRRGRATCGDIDLVLVERPGIKLSHFVDSLREYGLVIDSLTEEGETKYMGVVRIISNQPARRIDIRLIKRPSLGAALLYFTGSGEFNKIMRNEALKRGYTLNEYGLYRSVNGAKGELISASTEEEIFERLNFVYLTPAERDFL